jgi:hypothetical protein
MMYYQTYLFGFLISILMASSCKNHPNKTQPHHEINAALDTTPQRITVELENSAPSIQEQQTPLINESVASIDPGYGFNPGLIPPMLPIAPVPGFIGSDVSDDDGAECCCDESCDFANSGFSTMSPDDWYVIETHSYPDTVLLSKNRNKGFTQGGVALNPTGVTVKEAGNYWVTFSAIALYTNDEEPYSPLIPIFLIRNNNFDPSDDSAILGSVGSLPEGMVTTIQGSGVLKDVDKNTLLTIVATNGGSPDPEPITIVSWGISLFKICD